MNGPIPAGGEAMPSRERGRPTDAQIAKVFNDLLGDSQFLRQAAMVLEDYTADQFKSAKAIKGSPFSYNLTSEQAEGIQYLAMHVRDLAYAMEKAFERAFGLEGVQ